MNKPHTPESLFHAAVEALRAEDWLALTRLCDAESLDAFANQLREPYIRPPERRLTADMMMAHDPDMPQEVAEYYAAQTVKHGDPERRFRDDFPSLKSVDELLELPADRVVAAYLHGRSPRVQLEAQAAANPMARDHARHVLGGMENMHAYDLLGVVMDGASVAHVIYRPALPEDAAVYDADGSAILSPLVKDTAGRLYVEVLPCRKAPDGTWGIVADYRMFGIAATAFVVGGPE
jgi:hypothetical protein